MDRESVINPAEPFPEPSDFPGEDSGPEHEDESAGGEAKTTVGHVPDEEIRPFVYRPPVGQDNQIARDHPRRRRSDLSQMR